MSNYRYGSKSWLNKNQIRVADETNQQNREIHEQDIAAQFALQDKANAFTREQFAAENAEWDRRQEATSPAAMRQRYEEAGLNPYMILGNGGAGIGSTGSISSKSGASVSVPSAAPMQQVQGLQSGRDPMQVMLGMLSGAIEPIKALSDYKVSKAEAAKTEYEADITASDAQVRDVRNRLELANMLENWRKTHGEADAKELENYIFGNTLDSRIRKVNGEADAVEATARKVDLEGQVLAAGLPFIAPQALANLQNTVQDTILKAAQTNKTEKETAKVIAETITEGLKQQGIKLDNQQKAHLMPILVEQAIADLNSKRLDNDIKAPQSVTGRNLAATKEGIHGRFLFGPIQRFLDYLFDIPVGTLGRLFK